ncbi:MAG TPA: cytochrome c oxidase subunit 3, partial [Pyrinomonadaceae bacterium]|nr:cytochrome c oxidase subunit 3 [Pyrinomonadaceae bacterium]
LASQVFAWRELVAQGVYLATDNHSSFFYLLTGVHALHLAVGILALGFLLLRTRRRRAEKSAELKRRAAIGVVSVYWHFMDGLWILLFLLLFVWK